MIKRILIILILLSAALPSVSQRSTETVKVDGVKYYVHTVEKGHTLYAISKVYSVPIEEIVAANPGVEKGLSIGQKILIPKKSINKKQARSNPPQLVGGKLIHTVAQGETLFGIARKYKLSVEELERQNPQAKDGLEIGMQLVIDQANVEAVKTGDIKPALPEDYIKHTVKEKETLYGISKQYKVSIDSIVTINPGLADGLKAGTVLYIPKTEEAYTEQLKKEGLIFTPVYKPAYNIALILPFNLSKTDTVILENKIRMKPMEFAQSTLVSVEFYRGFQMAMDSLAKQGLNAEVFVYDLVNDSAAAGRLIKDPALKEMDLIFGPLHYSAFRIVSGFAHANGIKIISPINHPNRILLNNPEVVETMPSRHTQAGFLAGYLAGTDSSIYRNLVVYGDDAHSKIIEQEFKKFAIKQGLNTGYLLLNPSFKPDDEEQPNPQFIQLINALDSMRINRIFIASVNDGFIIPFFNMMNGVDTALYPLEVFGLEDLYISDQISSHYRHKYRLTLAVGSFIDYNNPAVLSFIREFRKAYNTVPSSAGFAERGFDNAFYFAGQLLYYGLNFEIRWPEKEEYTGLQNKYRFEKVNAVSGFENKGIYLIRYRDYELTDLISGQSSGREGFIKEMTED